MAISTIPLPEPSMVKHLEKWAIPLAILVAALIVAHIFRYEYHTPMGQGSHSFTKIDRLTGSVENCFRLKDNSGWLCQ